MSTHYARHFDGHPRNGNKHKTVFIRFSKGSMAAKEVKNC